ncbi:AAA family ATPase [Allofournierella sp. CML151]|uniref:AAA family ATPase n=1 Tax=Allofournierella sp. CML151 TaxID=2998082 RepID=UPI0022EB0298|nr:AAA family ATPase [Fournierella sp. CML151]
MAIPKVSREDILRALEFIDENGVPYHNQSMRYFLLGENGKFYPPKYVIAVANHLANEVAIDTSGYNAIEAKNYLKNKGFTITGNQEKYELTITAEQVTSTDECFDKDSLGLGDNFVPLGVYFQGANGQTIKRNYAKGERRNSNQTMPKLAFQIYEKQIRALSVEEKENFPVCQYSPDSGVIRGIFSSAEEYRKYHNSIEYLTYSYDNDRKFVIYSWNIFSTIVFVQECLKRFGEPGDRFVLTYREKQDKEEKVSEQNSTETLSPQQSEKECVFNGYRNPYSDKLIESRNIIFRGAPGTGKTYLAREIAADIISDGYFDDFSMLTDEQKEQVEFVQFHPSYDYSDFVEGLRPKINADGSMGFELKDGIFKRFVERARKNYENSQKSQETVEKETSAQESIADFFSSIEFGVDTFETVNKNVFAVTSADDEHIEVAIPGNATVNKLRLNTDELRQMLESDTTFTKVRDVTAFFGKKFATQAYSYDFALYKEIIKKKPAPVSRQAIAPEKLKKYIFIIDEINRGEISKIFGELFFALDPGYRGPAGAVSTQYANLHTDPSKKFYIPENVYIIGTMNDIDKSVDSFDFAMRRRFRFIEIRADERLEMLAALDDELESEAIRRMTALNQEILKTEELNENYQIGGSYFLKLKELNFDQLWTDYLCPLLQEYIRGMYDEAAIMNRFAQAYGYSSDNQEVENETAQS